MKRTLAISSLFVGTAILIACSSKPNTPPATPIATVDAGSDAAALPPDGGLVLAPAADAGGPVMPPFFTGGGDAGAAPPATLTDSAADLAIDALLAAAATKNAPKMAEEGAPGRQTMKEGDHLAMMINLQPNRCYTFIATSLPGTVTQLDVKLFGPPFYNVEAGKSAPADKALPIIGKGTAALCPMLPIAVPYKLDAAATKGAGRIGVKVYSRAK